MKLTLLCLILFASVQGLFAQKLNYTSWDVPANWNHEDPYAINYGEHMWVTDQGELVFRDRGGNETLFNNSNSPFTITKIYQILASDSNFYIATDSGLFIKQPGSWNRTYAGNTSLKSSRILSVQFTRTELVVLHDSGFSSRPYNDTTWSHYPVPGQIPPLMVNLYYKSGNAIWFADTQKLYVSIQGGMDEVRSNHIFIKNRKIMGFYESNGRIYNYNSVESSGFPGKEFHTFIDQVKDSNVVGIETDSGCASISTVFRFQIQGSFTDVLGHLWLIVRPNDPEKPNQVLNLSSSGFKFYENDYDTGYWNMKFDRGTGRIYLVDGRSVLLSEIQLYPQRYTTHLLDVNQAQIPVTVTNGVTYASYQSSPYSSIPKDVCANTIPWSTIWLSGKDKDEGLHVIGNNMNEPDFTDLFPGPLDTLTGELHTADSLEYNRIWKINASDIQAHLALYKARGVVLRYQTTRDIWEWPAHGDGGVSADLAPFIDQNHNGKYEPYLGDVPKIKGDQALYWIMNDNGGEHKASGGAPFAFEIHAMAYEYTCGELSASADEYGINLAYFVQYTVINRSGNDYHDVSFGSWNDVDIGNYRDDYIGCYVTENMGYGYNGDDFDEGLFYNYGINAPLQSVVFLESPWSMHDGKDNDQDGEVDEKDEARLMSGFMYYNNDYTVFGVPQLPVHYDNYLNAKWKNGDPLIMDCMNGRTAGIPSKYIFPGTSDPLKNFGVCADNNTGWTERAAGNVPSDRHFVMSTGPFNIDSGQEVVFELTYVFSHDSGKKSGNLEQLDKNIQYVRAIKDWYYGKGYPDCYEPALAVEDMQNGLSLNVFPNPATGEINIQSAYAIYTVRLYDLAGNLVGAEYQSNTNKDGVMDLNEISDGVYFISVLTEQGLVTQKFVVMMP